MSLSKNQIKRIQSLRQKKQRVKQRLFVAEGLKVVNEFLKSSFTLDSLFVTTEVQNSFEGHSFHLISESELKKISSLKTPNGVLALFQIPEEKKLVENELIVALDGVNDPGNLGTIIRLCDWFGITQLVCSKNTVDCYNEKVVQATMGSLSRVQINYLDLEEFLRQTDIPSFCADMDGTNVYSTQLPSSGVLVMGNEANGISEKISKCCTHQISIPRFGKIQATESLNVATATAILLSEFRRSDLV